MIGILERDSWFPATEPGAIRHVNENLTAPFNKWPRGAPHACQRTDHVSRRYPDPLSHQHVAARRPRQADLPRRRDRARRDLAAEIHRGVLAERARSPQPSLRANGSRECAPDDRLREAIHVPAYRIDGLLRRFAPPKNATETKTAPAHRRRFPETPLPAS